MNRYDLMMLQTDIYTAYCAATTDAVSFHDDLKIILSRLHLKHVGDELEVFPDEDSCCDGCIRPKGCKDLPEETCPLCGTSGYFCQIKVTDEQLRDEAADRELHDRINEGKL